MSRHGNLGIHAALPEALSLRPEHTTRFSPLFRRRFVAPKHIAF
ncbi:hypothetical protein GGD81_003305 [Rhodobium orientis]|nr:hypothetical protein [Rhodobium orientis]